MKQIEASELRVGNLVDYYEENHTFEVLEIHKGGIRVKDNEQETWIEYECFSPIELTEEWLFRFGFENWGKESRLHFDIPSDYEKITKYVLHNVLDGTSDFKVCLIESHYPNSEPCSEWVIEVDYDIYYFKEVKYVHNVQNIFYLIAGFELTINT